MEQWKRSLDNYLTGGRYREWLEVLICNKCQHRWEAKMYEEYGMSGYINDDDSVCPECKEEHE